MNEPIFPFLKYRDWGETPDQKPMIDQEILSQFSMWRQRTYKLPIFDDITGIYRFYPTKASFHRYVDAAARRSQIKDVAHGAEEATVLIGKVKRQRRGVAILAEKAIAGFLSVAVFRKKVLLETLGETYTEGLQEISGYGADAIADYGHCLLHPSDKSVDGDYSEGLKTKINEVAPDIGSNLQMFGNFAIDHSEVLQDEETRPVLAVTLMEQLARINYWQPRHKAVMDAFPTLRPSQGMDTISMPLAEILKPAE